MEHFDDLIIFPDGIFYTTVLQQQLSVLLIMQKAPNRITTVGLTRNLVKLITVWLSAFKTNKI